MKLTVQKKAIFALCVVALVFALLNVSVRFSNAGFGPFTQVYLRIGLGLLLTFIFFFKEIRFKNIKKISGKDWIILILMGTLGYGIAVDFVTLGVLHTTLLNAAVIGSTTPFFVFLFNIFALRKKFNSVLLFFLLLTFYGVCVLSTNSLVPRLANFSVGDFYILLFAIGSGFYILGRKFLSDHLNNSEIAILVMSIAFISSLTIAAIVGEPVSFVSFINPVALLGICMGGVLNLLATKLQNFGFIHLNAVAGSQLLLLQNIFAPIFGLLLFSETIIPLEFFGAFVVLAGVWLYIQLAKE
ncbi:MAG TPA: DMT family transporter [Candidatus Saccharimonadales bacterium]|nr:DMT family transporter [Candidatus Saccharimonadales bacterium]